MNHITIDGGYNALHEASILSFGFVASVEIETADRGTDNNPTSISPD
jgi:hypothetical protein